MLPTIAWHDDTVIMIDQRKLPATEIYVRCRSAQEVARAIKTMVIRGAPAIGVLERRADLEARERRDGVLAGPSRSQH